MPENKALDGKVMWVGVEVELIPRGWIYLRDVYENPNNGRIIVAEGGGRTIEVAKLNQQEDYTRQLR